MEAQHGALVVLVVVVQAGVAAEGQAGHDAGDGVGDDDGPRRVVAHPGEQHGRHIRHARPLLRGLREEGGDAYMARPGLTLPPHTALH